jgi:hypothetical protein
LGTSPMCKYYAVNLLLVRVKISLTGWGKCQ